LIHGNRSLTVAARFGLAAFAGKSSRRSCHEPNRARARQTSFHGALRKPGDESPRFQTLDIHGNIRGGVGQRLLHNMERQANVGIMARDAGLEGLRPQLCSRYSLYGDSHGFSHVPWKSKKEANQRFLGKSSC
jgi:hypothetical protein